MRNAIEVRPWTGMRNAIEVRPWTGMRNAIEITGPLTRFRHSCTAILRYCGHQWRQLNATVSVTQG